MKSINQYTIPFVGLKEGHYDYSFTFGKEFFDEYAVLDARDGVVKASVFLEKKPEMLTLRISMNGFLEIQCDRCLEYFNYPIDYQGSLIIKFGKDSFAGNDEIWILDPNEHEIRLEQHFFECIGLCFPIKRIHPDNAGNTMSCNEEMLNLLEKHTTCENKQFITDPRWNKLKELFNVTNK